MAAQPTGGGGSSSGPPPQKRRRLGSPACDCQKKCKNENCLLHQKWHVCHERRNCKYFVHSNSESRSLRTIGTGVPPCCCYICKIARIEIAQKPRSHVRPCTLHHGPAGSAVDQMYVLRMLPPDIETIREKEGIQPYSFREQRYARWYVGIAGKKKREKLKTLSTNLALRN